MKCKLLLFDLDGTLLQTDKTISKPTIQELENCRKHGIMIGVSTSRSEKNSMEFIAELNPDVVISSAGALVKYKDSYIYKAEFTSEETVDMIKKAREILLFLLYFHPIPWLRQGPRSSLAFQPYFPPKSFMI